MRSEAAPAAATTTATTIWTVFVFADVAAAVAAVVVVVVVGIRAAARATADDAVVVRTRGLYRDFYCYRDCFGYHDHCCCYYCRCYFVHGRWTRAKTRWRFRNPPAEALCASRAWFTLSRESPKQKTSLTSRNRAKVTPSSRNTEIRRWWTLYTDAFTVPKVTLWNQQISDAHLMQFSFEISLKKG